jgi:hypothetical protein
MKPFFTNLAEMYDLVSNVSRKDETTWIDVSKMMWKAVKEPYRLFRTIDM